MCCTNSPTVSVDLPRAKCSLWFNPELLEPGRRTQGVCTKETIQLSATQPQILLLFHGPTWPKFPLSPWGVKTRNEERRRAQLEMALTHLIYLLPRKKKIKYKHETWKFLLGHFLMTWMIQWNKWEQPGECSAPKGQGNICQCSSSANVWGC